MWAYDSHMPQYIGRLWGLNSDCQAWNLLTGWGLFLYSPGEDTDLVCGSPLGSLLLSHSSLWPEGPSLGWPLEPVTPGGSDSPFTFWKIKALWMDLVNMLLHTRDHNLGVPNSLARMMLRDHDLDLSNMRCYWTGLRFCVFPVDELGNTYPRPLPKDKIQSESQMPNLGSHPDALW